MARYEFRTGFFFMETFYNFAPRSYIFSSKKVQGYVDPLKNKPRPPSFNGESKHRWKLITEN